MYIDFKLIESGEDFELLCEDLLRSMGYQIVAKVARGPDLGRDLIVSLKQIDPAGFDEEHRYLVECKHLAKSGVSVKEKDIGSPIARMGSHDCDRYLLITSTVPSEKVRVQLDGIPNTARTYRAQTWSKGDLRFYLALHPKVRDRHFPLPDNVQVATSISSLLSDGGSLQKIKEKIAKNPYVLPIERYVREQYEYKAAVVIPGRGLVDCVAARADTEGMQLYMYYFGSAYESPFTASGNPKAELAELLTRSCNLACEVTHPLPQGHALHHAEVTGDESGGMKPTWIEMRREKGLGPYSRINSFIVVGQRSNRRTNYEFNIDRESATWLERYRDFEHGATVNRSEPVIQIMSYDRLLALGSVE